MRLIFIDASYWIALLNKKDALHPKALHLCETLQASHFYTSEPVLTEVMNYFSGASPSIKVEIAQFVEGLEKDPLLTILPQTRPLYHAGRKLYHQALDKHWSHTDCMSFVMMRQKKITAALTYDKHFEQAGFVALLRGD